MTAGTKNSSSDLGAGIGCLAVLAFVAGFIWWLLPDSWTDPIKYSTMYSVNTEKVNLTPKPKDCEFMHAPIGNKECHYKKVVWVYNKEGEIVDGDFAPQQSQLPADRKAVRVDVDWTKEKD